MSKKKRLITLLTDFGDIDSYLTELKGVILSINPGVEIVEASQKVEAGNIRQGAYLLGRYFKYYLEGTIHLAVVDPGVGAEDPRFSWRPRGISSLVPTMGFSLMFWRRRRRSW